MSETGLFYSMEPYWPGVRHRFLQWTFRYQLTGDISDSEPVSDDAVLFDNERAHIQHYRAPKRMNESRTGIRMIKTLVGHMCASHPAHIQLMWDAAGAPEVLCHDPKSGTPPISVSMSHSNGLVTAVCMHSVNREGRDRPRIGIDIEKRSDTLPASVLDLFSEPEQAWLSRLPQWQASLAFAQLWTRKEALFKCSTVALEEILSRNVIPDQIITRDHDDCFQLQSLYLPEIDMVTSLAIRSPHAGPSPQDPAR